MSDDIKDTNPLDMKVLVAKSPVPCLYKFNPLAYFGILMDPQTTYGEMSITSKFYTPSLSHNTDILTFHIPIMGYLYLFPGPVQNSPFKNGQGM